MSTTGAPEPIDPNQPDPGPDDMQGGVGRPAEEVDDPNRPPRHSR